MNSATLAVLATVCLFLFFSARKLVGGSKRGKTVHFLILSDDRSKLASLDKELADWDLPWRRAAFRRESPPHPELLRACYLANVIRSTGHKKAADLRPEQLAQIWFMFLSTTNDPELADGAFARLDDQMRTRSTELRARMEAARKTWDKWEAMQDAFERHSKPKPVTVPDGDLLTQLKAVGPDPDLWHDVASAADFDNPTQVAAIDWIVSQPACDKATIRSLGMSLNLFEYLDADASPHRPDIEGIVRKMMRRWNDGGYSNDDLAEANPDQDPKDYQADYRKSEAEILARNGTLAWESPKDFFRRSVGRVPQSRFTLSGDGVLVASAAKAQRNPPAIGWEEFDEAIRP
jgi:hypothetical protein